MGINFQAAHPSDVFEDQYAAKVVAELRNRFGKEVPLGSPGQCFCINDEMAWSWWSELQQFAAHTLGDRHSRHIRSVDAWMSVFIDVNIERDLIWPDGRPNGAARAGRASFEVPGESWGSRVLRRLRLKRTHGMPPGAEEQVRRAMLEMVERYGPRTGEDGAVQVGNLHVLKVELDSLLASIGVQPTIDAVEALRQSYIRDADRVDDDPHIQCLCHAWLTATHALRHRTPLWLVK